MAKYRGVDGSLKIATVAMGQLKNWNLTTQRPILDQTSMGDTNTSKTLDVGDWSATCEMHLDGANTEQAALIAQVVAGTEPVAIAAQFLVAAGKYFAGNILVARANIINGGKGTTVAFNATLEGTGALSMTWA